MNQVRKKARKSGFSILLVGLLIPMYLEVLDSELFTFDLPGPYSLGKICLIALGLYSIVEFFYFRNKAFIALLIILLGTLIGAFFANDQFDNLSASFGQMLLLFGSLGFAHLLLRNKFIYDSIFWLFLVLLVYWSIYVFQRTFLAGGVTYYSLFANDQAYNHHIPGFYLSLSAIFFAVYLKDRGFIQWWVSILILIYAVVGCVMIESRSNTLFLAFCALYFYGNLKRLRFTQILGFVALVSLGYLTINLVITSNSKLQNRFTLDTEQQSSTNVARLWIYENISKELIKNPFGKGIDNSKLNYKGIKKVNAHNQYLTWGLAGGLTALLGVGFLINVLLRYNSKIMASNSHKRINLLLPIWAVIAIAFITLLTIEFGGLLMNFLYALLFWAVYQIERLSLVSKQDF